MRKAKLVFEDGEEFEVQYDERKLEATITKALAVEPAKRWKPSHGERYWSVGDSGLVDPYDWSDDDMWAYGQGNVFKTRKEAEQYLTYLNAKAKIRNHAIGSAAAASEGSTIKRYIEVCLSDDGGHAMSVEQEVSDVRCNKRVAGVVYYPDEADALNAIDLLREEYLIVTRWEAEHGQ